MTAKTVFILCLFFGIVAAQQSAELQKLWELYSNFDYSGTLHYSDKILNDSTASSSEKKEVFLIRGMTYFSLNFPDSVRQSFIELLKIDKDYDCSPSIVPPKIITLFEEVKDEFNSIISSGSESKITGQPALTDKQDIKSEMEINYNGMFRNAIARSIILPGWGHLYLKGSTKGWLLSCASLSLIGSASYFAVKSSRAENDYLNETDWKKFDEKYNEYNKNYKIRNTLIIAYAVVWLYSQSDLLFNDEYTLKKYLQISQQASVAGNNFLIFSLNVPLN